MIFSSFYFFSNHPLFSVEPYLIFSISPLMQVKKRTCKNKNQRRQRIKKPHCLGTLAIQITITHGHLVHQRCHLQQRMAHKNLLVFSLTVIFFTILFFQKKQCLVKELRILKNPCLILSESDPIKLDMNSLVP